MGPWIGDSPDPGAAAAEKAMSFISKRISDVQKHADRDLQLMRARAKSFRDLATTLDKEWESFKIPAFPLGQSKASESLFNRTSDNNARTGLSFTSMSPLTAISSQVEDMELFKKLKPTLSNIRRSYSDPNFNKRRDEGPAGSAPGDSLVPWEDKLNFLQPKRKERKEAGTEWGAPPTSLSRRRVVHRDWQSGKGKKGTRKVKPVPDDWEPLRRMKETLKDSAAKSPSEFFESVKKNLRFSLGISEPGEDEAANDVAPLDVPELLESLVRQSEPLLDQLGVKKDVSEKFCEILRSYKKKDHQHLTASATKEILPSDANKDADDLDLRIASVVQSTGYRHKGGLWGESLANPPAEGHRQNIAIITTASLPWMTGTAVNPLFRAAYLAKSGKKVVTLLVPWLSKSDQELVYPNNMTFDSPEEQSKYVHNWVEARVGFKPDFKIAFYPGKFSTEKRSILASGDISQFVPDDEAQVAVLEEPEHLTWYYHGKRWTDKFQHVVGVVHTNYLEYVKREKNGPLQAFFLEHVNNWMVRIYCNKVLRLSAATQMLPKSSVCNVHGVSPKFLDIGKKIAEEKDGGKEPFSKGAYFLGKMIWGKGYRELVDLMAQNKQFLGHVNLDVYGTGEDSLDVQATASKLGLAMNFYPGRDHADDSLHGYKVFINPSISDVVCTTTAEALAMGKIVVCADHPSNEFFRGFPNCYTYRTAEEFVRKVKKAMESEPVPLSPEQQHLLSWEAATDRFIDSSDIDRLPSKGTVAHKAGGKQKKTMTLSMSMPNLSDGVDNALAFTHFFLSGIEAARYVAGALPDTMHFNEQQCKDLGLPPPYVQKPVYGW